MRVISLPVGPTFETGSSWSPCPVHSQHIPVIPAPEPVEDAPRRESIPFLPSFPCPDIENPPLKDGNPGQDMGPLVLSNICLRRELLKVRLRRIEA